MNNKIKLINLYKNIVLPDPTLYFVCQQHIKIVFQIHAIRSIASLHKNFTFRDKEGKPMTPRGEDGKPPINFELQVSFIWLSVESMLTPLGYVWNLNWEGWKHENVLIKIVFIKPMF